ncbi:hypothetical protein J1N35_002003 [Gossypium stocksii]|uniref:Uncharacterized protein n=1 Tax=Gossypium stocksii TaxID=47602 RepID=A0A9D3WKX5_9ROSI|nr:hypothetical protein J1N35_002003 [Gossypium stocksii]
MRPKMQPQPQFKSLLMMTNVKVNMNVCCSCHVTANMWEKLERPSTKGYLYLKPTQVGPTGQGTVLGGQFLWGVGLPKGNRGVQRFPRAGRRLAIECKGRRELDCRPTRQAVTKVSLNDPMVLSGKAVAQRIKVTLWITGGSSPIAHIFWHLDVGSLPPGAVVCSTGWAVRPLKRYVSWVQNVVRQFGPYPV